MANKTTTLEGQIAFQNLLRQKFEKSVDEKGVSLSQKKFSERIGISQGAFSEIMNGDRVVSVNLILKIFKKLQIDLIEQAEVMKFFPTKKELKSPKTYTEKEKKLGNEFRTLSEAEFEKISTWEHYAILSLVKLKSFQSNDAWIAKRLGISREKARASLERLISLSLIKATPNGTFIREQFRIKTSDDLESKALKKFHKENLKLAIEKIENVPVQLRDYTSMTLTLDIEKLHELKKIIRLFYESASQTVTSIQSKEVYHLSVQCFPLTVVEDKR